MAQWLPMRSLKKESGSSTLPLPGLIFPTIRYFNKIGVFLGADVNLNRYNWDGGDKTRFGFGMEGGYAFFLSRTVTIEPAVYWDINKDRSEFGLKVGFGFYF